MNVLRSNATLFIGHAEISRTLLVEHQNGVISNVHLEDDNGGTVEITGTLSIDDTENLAESLGL